MIDTKHPRDVDCATQRPVTPGEGDRRNNRRRAQIPAVQMLPLTVNGRSLRGLLPVYELDLYSDEVALRAWNAGPLEPCAQSRSTLSTRIRRAANEDARAAHHRTGRREHPAAAEPYQPIHRRRA